MEHEAFGNIAAKRIHTLFISCGAEGGNNHRLGFAAAEKRGTMRARQKRSFNLDGPHAPDIAPVNPYAFPDNAPADNFFLEIFEHFARLRKRCRIIRPGRIRGKGFHDLCLDGLAGILAGQFFGHAHGFRKPGIQGKFFHPGQQGRIGLWLLKNHLGLAARFPQLLLGIQKGLDFIAAPFQGIDNHVLGHKTGLALDHGQGIAGSGKNQVDIALRLFIEAWIEHELAVDAANAGAGNGAGKGQRGNHQGGGGACQGQNIGFIFLVGGNHTGQNLHILIEPFWKKRPDGAVDQTGNQGFPFRRASNLAAEKAARDTARGIHFFGIFHGKGEEALVELQRLRTDSYQHDCASALHPDRAISLVGHSPAFKNYFPAAHHAGYTRGIENVIGHKYPCIGITRKKFSPSAEQVWPEKIFVRIFSENPQRRI